MHLTETQINDYLDDALSSAERDVIVQHIAACRPCREEIAMMRTLLERVADLPAAVQPERDLRASMWAQVDRRTLWHFRYPLAAAAVLLIVLTSGITFRLRPYVQQPPVVRETPAAPSDIDFVVMERRYTTELAELQNTLRTNRDRLAPETVRILEENLRIIDSAIREARSALANDPQSAMLGELLRSAYQQKLDLLKQAARSSET